MSAGPPFDTETSDNRWTDWKSETRRLDYPGRNIRIIFPEQRRESLEDMYIQPADFGDFDPNPEDPDPDVWPVKEVDPGYPADVDDLFLVSNTFPAPHVAWVTEEYLEARYGYNPVRQKVEARELPPWARPKRADDTDMVEVTTTGDHSNSMEMTEDRVEALSRLARLWNGKEVRGHHLLTDKCPDWMDIFGDLSQDELRRFVVDPSIDPEFADVFSDHDWYERGSDIYTKPERVLRKKVWYAPTQRGRVLINRRANLPDLKGDPNEGLTHRVSVGLAMLDQVTLNRKVDTYREYDGYVLDIVSKSEDGDLYVAEVMTGHHNWRLHRRTHRKLRELHENNFNPYVVFDSRETAYRIMNHWQNKGLCELPGGSFDSDWNISKGREKIRDAYQSEELNWIVGDWTTTSQLWRNTLGPNGPELDGEKIKSYSW